MSWQATPSVWLFAELRFRAAALGTNPSVSIFARIFRRSSGPTPGLSLSARDTVAAEIPMIFAMSWTVLCS